MKILWYVQNVLGIGHVMRSLKICNAYIDAQITFVVGGAPFDIPCLPHVKIVQLPGIMMNESFSEIFPHDRTQTLKSTWEKRKQILINLLCCSHFDIIVTEIFPFGRSSFRWEILELLKYNKLKPIPAKVVCSLRDVLFLEHDDPDYFKDVTRYTNNLYDLVLVHSDAKFLDFKRNIPFFEKIIIPVEYTGYVVDRIPDISKFNRVSICVNVGSGSVCSELIYTCIESSIALSSVISHDLYIYLGPYTSQEEKLLITKHISNIDHIFLKEFDPTFSQKLKQFHLSISLAGYNTTLELIAAGIPGIVYPFYLNHEQNDRLKRLNTDNQLTVLTKEDLTTKNMLAHIQLRLQDSHKYKTDIDLNGIDNTIQYLKQITDSSNG